MSLNNWMAPLNSSTLLSHLDIPGTHESCARYDHATAGFTQCQWLSIREQLDHGIRFLDIRCTYEVDGTPFEITHGGYTQKITFAEVQRQVIEFLDANPSETVLMNVQQEYSHATNADFVARFNSIVTGHEDHWFFEERVPMLGEVRKRIVLVRAYNGDKFDADEGKGGWLTSKGIPWNGFDSNGVSHNLYFVTQNAWNAYESTKMPEIEKMLGLPGSRDRLGLNFLSYAHAGATPGNNAEAMNPAILRRIKKLDQDERLGVLPMDFATNTPGFIEEIVRRNPSYDNTKGNISWYEHSGWRTGAPGGSMPGVAIGQGGWTGFKSIFATSDGVLYAIDWYGNLNRYRDADWRNGGAPMSLSPGVVAGVGGWDKFKFVFATGKGVLYAVDAYGNLNRYRDTDWQRGDGSLGASQLAGEGGWDRYQSVFATSEGVIYAIDSSGDLWWYKDTDWQQGNGLVGARKLVGKGGWNLSGVHEEQYRSVFATSDGLLYAIDWFGNLWWYAHADWQQGNGVVGGRKLVGAGGWGGSTVFATSDGRIYATRK